jgi:hypothetical protein
VIIEHACRRFLSLLWATSSIANTGALPWSGDGFTGGECEPLASLAVVVFRFVRIASGEGQVRWSIRNFRMGIL